VKPEDLDAVRGLLRRVRVLSLGDFSLYRLEIESGRLVAGFARAVTLRSESFRELAAREP
jgi:hypothetical protein